jgi:signal transduction histidine kinase
MQYSLALKEIHSTLSLRKVLQAVLKWSMLLFDTEINAVFVTNLQRQSSRLLIMKAAVRPQVMSYRISKSQELEGWFFTSGKATLVNDAGRANLFFKAPEWQEYGAIRNVISAPLKARPGIAGALQLMNRRQDRPFSRRDLASLELWAEHTALAIENAQQYESERDFNRELKRQIHLTTDQLRNANAKLREADQARSENISMIAHELRSPVTSVSGFAKLLLKGNLGSLTGEQTEFCSIIQKNASNIERLISDLLDLTKLELGKLEMHYEFIACQDLVREAVFSIQGNIPREQRRIRLHLPEEVWHVRGDRLRLLQVLNNLLSNALKYSPPESPIDVNCRVEGGEVIFEVEDRGHPLNEEQQIKIFEKFYRIKNMATNHPAGSGLGLAIAQITVSNHGGRIWVRNAEEAGNVFCFSLPRIHNPADVAAVLESLTNQGPSYGKKDHIQN